MVRPAARTICCEIFSTSVRDGAHVGTAAVPPVGWSWAGALVEGP